MKRHDDILAQMGYQSKDEWLPEPVIDGRRAAMSLFNIGRGQMQIAAHHCHGGMSENRLKGKHVAAIGQRRETTARRPISKRLIPLQAQAP
jgi:hypothetical protein